MFRIVPVIALAAAAAAGCTAITQPNPGAPAYAPVAIPEAVPAVHNDGGIYQAGHELFLFEDVRSRRVGDLLTVLLREATDARKSARSSAEKTTDLGVDVDEFGIGSRRFGSSSDFSGGGQADQSNALEGEITVTVAQVLPNGVLVVQGEKWVTINQGREFIRLRGRIRPVDVRPDNTVLSERIADVQIAYGGEGTLADTSRPGWLSRLFQSGAWPL